MASVGSVELSLVLNRTQFNQDLRELQRLKLDCLPIKLCADFNSFNRELKKQLSGQYAVTLDTQDFEKQIENAFTNALKRVEGSGLLKDVGGLLSAPLKGLGAIGGSLIQGVAIGVTSQVSTDFGKGLSQAIQKATGSTVGSSELLGQRAGESLSQGISKAIDKTLPEQIKESFAKSIREALGETDILSAAASASATGARRRRSQTDLAQEGLNIQRRDALRQVYDSVEQRRGAQATQDLAAQNRSKAEASLSTAQSRRFDFQLGGAVPQSFLEQFPELAAQGVEQVRNKYGIFLDNLVNEISAQITRFAQVEAEASQEIQRLTAQIENRKAAALRIQDQQKKLRPPQLPAAYLNLVKDVTGKDLPKNQIPKLRINDQGLKRAGAVAQYDVEANVVEVSKELFKALEAGKLSVEQLRTLYEEIAHAAQFDFGSVRGVEARRQLRPLTPDITPTADELKRIGPELGFYAPEKRGFELQAKVVASRKAQSASAKQEFDRAIADLTGQSGIAGERIEQVAGAQLQSALTELKSIEELATRAGADMSREISSLSQSIYGLSQKLQQSIGVLLDIQVAKPNVSLVIDLKSIINRQFEELEQVLVSVNKFKKDAVKIIGQGTSLTPTKKPLVDLEIAPKTSNKPLPPITAIGSTQEAQKAAADILSAFRSTRKQIADLLKSGNAKEARAYGEVFVKNAQRAQQELTTILQQSKGQGLDKAAQAEISAAIGRAKGTISNMLKSVNRVLDGTSTSAERAAQQISRLDKPARQARIARIENVLQPDDEGGEFKESRLNFSRRGLGRGQKQQLQDILRILREAEAASDRFDTAINRATRAADRRLEDAGRGIAEELERIEAGIPPVNRAERAIGRLGQGLAFALKGFIAFQAAILAQNLFSAFVGGSTQAAIALDRVTTSLSFASGGAAAGAKNLAFVRTEVDRLKISLSSSQEGFTKLAAATRGTALAGQTTKDIFTGVSEASTVLSLSAEQTSGIFTALSQSISGSTVQMEELRQLVESGGLVGGLSLAARAIGVTEAQLRKLLRAGQVAAEDFFPRFARQLKAEFGDAAVTAAGNAQSAIFNLQNQTLKLQESFGKTVQPAFVLGLNAASGGMKFLADNSQSALVALTTLGGFIAVPLLKSLFQLAGALPLVQAGLAGVKGGLIALRAAAVPMLLTFGGITAALEIFKAGNQLINGGPLTRELDDLTEASRNAAKAFGLLKEVTSTPITLELPSANVFDDLIKFANRTTEEYIRNAPFSEEERAKQLREFAERKPYTYAEKDRDDTIKTLKREAQLLSQTADAALKEVVDSKAGKTKLSLLPQLEIDIQNIANQRKVLQGRIQREFEDKGLQVPSELKTQLEGLNSQYNNAIAKQQEYSKTGVEQFNGLNRNIEIAKSKLKSLSDPATIASYGGEEFVAPIRKDLEQVIVKAEPAKDALADLLATTKADPILAMTDAFRKLNLELAKTTEQSQLAFATQRETIAKNQLGGFSSDVFATRRASLTAAQAERDRLAKDLQALERDFAGKQAAIAQPSFKPVLDRFGLTAQSTAADIQGLLDLPSTKDEDKSILETLKTAKEAQLKLHEARTQFYESENRVRSEAQAQAIDSIQHVAARTQAIIQQSEDAQTIAVKRAVGERRLTEEQAAVELARIQADATAKQKQSVDLQLQNLRDYHSQGFLSAETFDAKERELVLRQSSLKRQLAEQELAVREEINKQILNGIEQANQKVEAAIQRNQTLRNTQAKQQQLQLLRTPGDQKAGEFAVQRQNIDAERTATSERIGLIKTELEQTRLAEQNKLISAKEATQKRIQLQQQLAEANGRLIDLEIDQEKLYRDEVIHGIDVQVQSEKNRSDLAVANIERERSAYDLLADGINRTKQLSESRFDLQKALSDAALASSQIELDGVNKALELRKRLDDQNLDPSVRSEIGKGLAAAGFSSGASELEIVRRRQAIEEDIANKRLAALQTEQEYQKRSLELDLRRQQITAETVGYEAEIGVLRAQQAQIEAQGALARAGNDTLAREAAQIQLEIANRQLELSNKQLANSKENLKIQGELADNALRAQSATQQAALDQANAGESARQQAEGLERAEAAANRRMESVTDPSAAFEDLSDGKAKRKPTLLETARNQLPEIRTTTYLPPDQSRHQGLNPRTSVEAFFKRRLGLDPLESAESQYKRSLGLNPRESAENYFNRQLGLIESPTVSRLSSAAKPVEVPAQTTGYAQFVGGLKEANKDIVSCLRELIDANKAALTSPRSLSVSSPTPVSDAATIYSQIARMSITQSGLG